MNNEHYIDPKRAIAIIEGLTIEKSDEGGLYSLIYRIAHAARNPDCNKNHPDFVRDAYETERKLVADGSIPKWKE